MVLPLKLPLGTSDFRKFRQPSTYYADKTDLIRELIDLPQDAVLFPRPRRFGKTTNLSMLRTFFGRQNEDLSSLFEGLAILQAGPEYRAHLGRYPVISLSFKDAKAASWEDCRSAIATALSLGFAEHKDLLAEANLTTRERRVLLSTIDGQPVNSDTAAALLDLSAILHRHHGQPALILIDEYDTPILSGYQYGYLDEVSLFFRNLLSGALKDNRHLFKGVLTGVLRIARENLFSGLNSIITHDLRDRRFATAFGFTENEVEQLMVRLGRPEVLPELRAWYNGYNFAGQVIYNPWSVLSYAANPERGFVPYWVQTSADDALRGLVLQRAFYVLPEFQRLLLGQTIEKPVSDHVTLRDLHNSPDGIWSLMLHAGYLKYTKVRTDPMEARSYAELCIPNQEIRYVFVQSVLSWIASTEQGTQPLDQLLAAMRGQGLRGTAAAARRGADPVLWGRLPWQAGLGAAGGHLRDLRSAHAKARPRLGQEGRWRKAKVPSFVGTIGQSCNADGAQGGTLIVEHRMGSADCQPSFGATLAVWQNDR